MKQQLKAHANEQQIRIWREMPLGAKIRLVERFWQQARALKRGMLRANHPDWSEQQLALALREAMCGERR